MIRKPLRVKTSKKIYWVKLGDRKEKKVI